MMRENAKKQVGIVCGGLSLLLGAVYFVGMVSLPPQPRGDTRASTLMLLCLGVGALLGAASLKFLSRRPGRLSTAAGMKRAKSIRPHIHPEKQALFFRMEITDLLALGFGDFARAAIALRAEMDAATGKHPDRYTLGDLEQFIVAHVANKTERQPLLRPAFYRVRAALQETVPIARQKVRPSSRLDAIFPREDRDLLWRAFYRRLGATPPPLELPYGFRWLAVLAMLPFLCIASVGLERGPTLLAFFGLAGFVALLFLFGRMMRALGFATQIPDYSSTVRQLVNGLAHRELATIVVLDEATLRARVQKAFSRVSRVPQEQIRSESPLGNFGKVLAGAESD